MTFQYFKFKNKIIRPLIPIIIKSPTKVALYSALIDSGADHCIFGLDVAEALDIKLKPKNRVKITGLGTEEIQGLKDELEIRIGNKTYTTKVIFAKTADYGFGILGQQGFFDHFDVKLSYQKQVIEIEPIKPYN